MYPVLDYCSGSSEQLPFTPGSSVATNAEEIPSFVEENAD
jgi:hypothetical protein